MKEILTANLRQLTNKTDLLFELRNKAEFNETHFLHTKAAFSKDHNRLYAIKDDHRLPYKRDVDRILHSNAYVRYIDKTQVVYLVQNDHIAHRNLHVQLVSSFARGIAEILRLNLDLVEAIALGHDVGHPPFGHEGEGYLSELSIEFGNGAFTHSWQSCRLFSEIEPLNLGLAVYDGFLCHDGGMSNARLMPRFGKTWDDHFEDKMQKFLDPDQNIMPGSLEGCLVKLCDTMSYIGRDIEDAIRLGILNREQVPKTILGVTNREILTNLACDLIWMSFEKEYIEISEETFDALKILRRFNFENIYHHPKIKVESQKVRRSYRMLFELLLDDLDANKENSFIWTMYLENKPKRYLEDTTSLRKVVDYISGMTDNYFIRTLERLVIPKKIELT